MHLITGPTPYDQLGIVWRLETRRSEQLETNSSNKLVDHLAPSSQCFEASVAYRCAYMIELLAPIFLGLTAIAVFDVLSQSDDAPNGGASNEDPQPETDAPRTIQLDEVSSFCGGDQDEEISVNAKTTTTTFYDWDGYVSQQDEPAMEVRGGVGDDTLRLSGGGYRVFGDEGADAIYAGDSSDIAIYGGTDDTVIGGTGEDVYVRIGDNALFVGGDGDDFVISSSTSHSDLGNGNDFFLGLKDGWESGETSIPDLVYGGQGDDFIIGSARESYLWSAHANDQDLISRDVDTIYGGDGSDTILGSHGDHLFGGEGVDDFQVVLNLGGDFSVTSIEDFEPWSEYIEVRVGDGDGVQYLSDHFQNLDFSDFSQHVNEAGDALLSDNSGQPILRIVGGGELKIGFEGWNSDLSSKCILDLNGNEIERADCQVIIRGQIDAFF